MRGFSPLKDFVKEARAWFLDRFRYRLQSRGRLFFPSHNVYIRPGCLTVGDYVFVGSNSHISCTTTLGNFVMIASFVSIVGGDHQFQIPGIPSIFSGRDVIRPVVLEDDVWIGQGCIVLHGTRIGEGSIIGAGSLVTRDIPAYSVAFGSPARVVRPRFQDESRARHEAMLARYRRERRRQPEWKFSNETNPSES